ncbi:MAG: ATP-binding cassette domain-containing protein [Acidobacteriota bacterium]
MSLFRSQTARPSDAPVVVCRGLRKAFRSTRRREGLGLLKNLFRREVSEFVALHGIDLEIRRGAFVGLIGVNGAGKTTLVKCLTGIIPVTSGTSELLGRDSFRLRDDEKRRLSLVMGSRSQLWWDLPAVDSFRLLAEIYEVDRAQLDARVKAYASRLDVGDRLGVQLRNLSLGERMKMEIIGAFLHDPELVFLDEPTIGLDLLSRETIRLFLREINRERGVTIVLTSHDMEDIEETCERLVILDAGRILFDGDLVDLKRRLIGKRSVEIHLVPGAPVWDPALDAEIASLGASLAKSAPLHLTFSVPAEHTQALVKRLLDHLPVRDIAIERQPLAELIREIFSGQKVVS